MTTNKEQSGGKRPRSRKSDRRGQKAGQERVQAKVQELIHEPAELPVHEPAQVPLHEPVHAPVHAFEARDEDQTVQVAACQVAASQAIPEEAASELAPMPLIGEVIPPDVPPAGTTQPAAGFAGGIHAIANAYSDYTRKSFQESRSFVERLMGVRSFEEAIEVQGEFAKLAYANFVAESQKMVGLYGQLARQFFRPWGFVATITHVRRQIP